jgi:hypothetical protein
VPLRAMVTVCRKSAHYRQALFPSTISEISKILHRSTLMLQVDINNAGIPWGADFEEHPEAVRCASHTHLHAHTYARTHTHKHHCRSIFTCGCSNSHARMHHTHTHTHPPTHTFSTYPNPANVLTCSLSPCCSVHSRFGRRHTT